MYCPSRSIVRMYRGQDGYIVQWSPTVHLHIRTLFYCPSCPIIPWTNTMEYVHYPTVAVGHIPEDITRYTCYKEYPNKHK